ncbi:MAG TPA: adenylate/guanylate cyclase domain-containing protein [Gaiellaceae bacterium]
MRELPRGTVTFLFTDIEGSTRLLHELGAERYAAALDEHRQVVREAFSRYDGAEVDTQGDAFFVAFPTAPGALEAAREAQEGLSIAVRMGIHTGTPLLVGEGYVGEDVHRAARIAAAGHGGQVLVSAATASLLRADGLRDLGEHRLKDLSAPERIYQLGDGDFPALKTLYRTNLPVPATPFLGRDVELEQVHELLASDETRLLTLSGPGGSGKTRLALQAAGLAAEAYPDGTWWVPLASVQDPDEVLPAASRALGGAGPLDQLVGDRRLLLLLDNFEHVVDAAPEVSRLLSECRRVDVLLTSRERLRVQGEQVYPVPVLERAESRELFAARARAAQPSFEPGDDVDELCARLDDLPLALELAAARTALLTTEQLLERLGSRLDLLRGGRDAEVRQRTLRATIEWSYELLEPEEQRLLAALSIFRGGWTLEAAERVCEADVELLQSLVDKSLVRRWESGRFGMLETVREFAAEQLEPGRRDELLRRLLEQLMELFEDADLRPESARFPGIELAQEERANIDVALQWATEAGEVESALRLLWMLEMYWITNDPVGGRERVNALLDRADVLDPASYARALRFRGAAYDLTGETALAAPDYERAIEVFRSIGDEDQVGHLKLRIANDAFHEGDVERAVSIATEALEQGNRRDEAIALNILSRAAFAHGDAERGSRLGRDSAAAAEDAGFTWYRAVTLLGTAEALLAADMHEAALRDFLDGLEALAAVRDRVNLAIALAAGAAMAARLGDAEGAGTLWGAAEMAEQREPRPTTAEALRDYAEYVEPEQGEKFEAGRSRGRALSLEEAVQYALTRLDSSR